MEKYSPPFDISNKMLELVSSISEKVGKISNRHNLESRPHLRRNNRILSIHSSLKIEANSLSLNQVRDVIDGNLVLGEQKEIQEVKNAYSAYEKIPEIDISNIQDLLNLHGIMTHKTVEESGKFRSGEEGVFQDGKCIFVAPPAKNVSGLMTDLMSWLKNSKNNVHPLIASSIFHYEFVFIHPFSDGNGRMARLWHTAILYNWRDVFEFIPIESQIEKFQNEYYDAIAKCHENGNSNVFIEFMLKMIDTVIDDVAKQINKENIETSEYVKRLLNVMEFDVPYSANSLLEALNLKSKETLRKNYIDPAIKLGLIRMTLPEKPKSKNQRYVKF